MHLILRLALACLLILGLPLQGLAAWAPPAGVMQAVSGSVASAAPMADRQVAAAPRAADEAVDGCPDHPAGGPEAPAATGSACPDCGACTHCALSAPALMPSPLDVPPAPGMPAVWPAPLLTPEPPWPAGLERPPRFDRA